MAYNRNSKSKTPKVTRIVSSWKLSNAKLGELRVLAERCGRLRTDIWQKYDTPKYFSRIDQREIRDRDWLAKGSDVCFAPYQLPASIGWETLRDCLCSIATHHEAAKAAIIKGIYRHTPIKKLSKKAKKKLSAQQLQAIEQENTANEQKREALLERLRNGSWQRESWLHRYVRKYWNHRGRNHCYNQIVYMPLIYRWFKKGEHGLISVQGKISGRRILIPLNSNHPITSTIRLIVHKNHVAIHHSIPEPEGRACGSATVGVDMGYTEVFTAVKEGGDPNQPTRYGLEFGKLQTASTDAHVKRQKARNHLRSIADKAEARGDHAKAKRIRKNNLGKAKQEARLKHTKQLVRGLVYEAAHKLFDAAGTVIYEDLSFRPKKRKKGQKRKFGRRTTNLLNSWRKQVIREALGVLSRRRRATARPINAAYTSQVCTPECGAFGRRIGDRFHCTSCGAVSDIDGLAASNILLRDSDSEVKSTDLSKEVKSILEARYRQRLRRSRQDSSTEPSVLSAESEECFVEANRDGV
jgi:Putative transposase DNA-binding domain.